MNAPLPRLAVAALLLSLSVNALAGPGGPGGGPGWRGGPGPGWGGPGPRHGHGLPDHARELWIGSALYFVAAGSYNVTSRKTLDLVNNGGRWAIVRESTGG